MQIIIYDVAVSIDGYIAGPDGDISKFPSTGQIVDDYTARLQTYSCAIMGRATYEFGYRYGLEPGQNPYPHMRTIVFSRSIELPDDADVEIVRGNAGPVLDEIRNTQPHPIYLCGGGKFAGSLLSDGQIDTLRLKRAPLILGSGTPLFEGALWNGGATCIGTEIHDDGYLFQEYRLDR